MPWEKSWGATNGKGVLKYPFPPTVFYMMKRDLQVGAALRCGVPRCCAQRSATCRQAGCPSDGRQARACVCSGSCSPLPRRAQCLMRTASCVPPPPPPSPPAHPQTKMQIEKAVDILRKNKVNSDYVYVSAARLAPLPLPLPLLLPPSVPRCA